MKTALFSATIIFSILLISNCEVHAMTNALYDIEVNTITGQPITLGSYRGKALLIVNTASKCGFTKQFSPLQKLYDKYSDRGLVILGFPSNDFLWQEPKSNSEIQEFCSLNYGVTFPMFEKISVRGRNQHSLYTYLTSKETNPEYAGKISWNFNKFLVSPAGEVINRFGTKISPDDPKLIEAIEGALPSPATE